MSRLTVTAATLLIIGASTSVAVVASASEVTSAPPACVSVSTTGTVSGNHSFGPFCAPNPLGGPECLTQEAGFSPQAMTETTVCLPSPV